MDQQKRRKLNANKDTALRSMASRLKKLERSIEEKGTLSSFDSAFLFTFTIIAFLYAILNIYFGSLTGFTFIPLLVLIICMYPFYIGVYHGIMQNDIYERLAAWQFLFLLIMLVCCLLGGYGSIFTVMTIVKFPQVFPSDLWGSVMVIVIMIVVLLIFFVFAMLLPAWNGLLEIYGKRLGDRELDEQERRRTFSGHAFIGASYLSITYLFAVNALIEMYNSAIPVIRIAAIDPFTNFVAILIFLVVWAIFYLGIRFYKDW
ncbi:MAG: hypothetical protein WED05_00535 [Candidatus Atabeyarchaeum deiterrae]